MMSRQRKLLNRAVYLAHMIGMYVCVVLMLFTTADVVGRYFLNKPVLGSFELTQLMMVIIFFWSLAHTQVNKGHVSIDILVNLLPERAREVIDAVMYAFATAMFIVMTWQSVMKAHLGRLGGETTVTLQIPLWPFYWAIAVGFFLLAIVLIVDTYDRLVRVGKMASWRAWLGFGAGIALISLFPIFCILGPQFGWVIGKLTTGLYGVGVLFILMFLGMPVSFVMTALGFLGIFYLVGARAAFGLIMSVPFTEGASYTMSTMPLFILMGMYVFYSGIGEDLYWTGYKWLGRLPGGLAMATVAACAALAAATSSSATGVVIFGTVARPEMKKYNYQETLIVGCIAAGSTLGILIPPSVMLIIYAMLTEESIGRLFMGGFIPGILEAVFYIVLIYIICRLNPSAGPRGPVTAWKERITSLGATWEILALFLLVMGGIYGGVFTPIEAAGVGGFAALVLALIKRRMSKERWTGSLEEAGRIMSMALFLLVTATILGYFLAVSRVPFELAEWVKSLPLGPMAIMGFIILIYIMLGCFMSAIAAVIVTVPIFFPVAVALGFDPIWFGIIVVRMMEIGAITPPYGINLFYMKGIAKDVPMATIYKGCLPFVAADILHVSMLLFFPQVVTWLPSTMFGA